MKSTRGLYDINSALLPLKFFLSLSVRVRGLCFKKESADWLKTKELPHYEGSCDVVFCVRRVFLVFVVMLSLYFESLRIKESIFWLRYN